MRRSGPLVLTEVGSPKDYPGTWAGYECYETGIVQTGPAHRRPGRHRVDPADLAHGRARMWGRWSPGRLADRCFVHLWPSGQ